MSSVSFQGNGRRTRPSDATLGPEVEHLESGRHLPPTLTPRQAAELFGWSERTVRDYCHDGLLPVMARRGSNGRYRIITAKLLDSLGLLQSES